jgi:hypothetical protein
VTGQKAKANSQPTYPRKIATLQLVHEILRDRLLKRVGLDKGGVAWYLAELDRIAKHKPSGLLTLEMLQHEIIREVWCPSFFKLMFNRLLMGRLRYGRKKPDAPKYDFVKAIETKLKLYRKTRNLELMVDIGNYAMLEFHIGDHPDSHFTPYDDDGGHAELKESKP